MRRAEWIQNFLVKSNVDLGDGGTKQVTPHVAHTGDKAPNNVVGFLERVLVRSRINDDKQPRFQVGRGFGHKDADIVTLMEDGSVHYDSSCKYSPEGRSDAEVHEHQNALAKMKKHETKGAKAAWPVTHGINLNLGRKHTFECLQTTLPSLVADSLWTVKFNADGTKCCNVMNMKVMLNTEMQNACISHTNNLTNVQTRS